ncbi:MAG TPA: DUF6636 domain-containing protein [Gaiellaceae bacterium]|nr:DUF6636 domain-containing protein [Gaiellaceae bacterium]
MLRGSIAVLALTVAVAALASTAGARTSKIAFFRTPSGNIGCIAATDPTALRCDIKSGLRPRPAAPNACHLAYGDSLEMSATGRPGYTCHGDTVFDPRAKVLAYGKTFTFGPFRCTSQSVGLTCRNRAGHGWFLSRANYRRF